MGAGRNRVAASTVWALAWLGVAVAIGLMIATPAYDAATLPFGTSSIFFWIYVLAGFINGPVAALLLSRTFHPGAWITGAVALGFSAAAACSAWAVYGYTTGRLPLVGITAHAANWIWVAPAFASVLCLPWMLQPTRPSRAERAFIIAGAGVSLALTLPRIVLQEPAAGAPPNPFAVGVPAFAWIAFGMLAPALVLGIAAVVNLIRATRSSMRARGAYATVTIALITLLATIFTVQTVSAASLGGLFVAVVSLLVLAQVLYPMGVLVLVLRSRLWGLDVTVSRLTTWTLLTGLTVAAYGTMLWAGGMLLPQHSTIVQIVAVAVLAVGLHPLRTTVQRAVDSMVYGPASDLAALFQQLSTQVASAGDHRLIDALCSSIAAGLNLERVELLLESPNEPVTARPSRSRLFLLDHDGDRIGRLRLTPRPGEHLDLRTCKLLEDITPLLAAAIHLTQLNDELTIARARVVAVRDEERRVVRRELHDGVVPAFAGLALGLAAARKRLGHDAAGAANLLSQLEDEASARARHTRELARDVLPPHLDAGDLAGALEHFIGRYEGALPCVALSIEGEVRVDSASLMALYHVAVEAVTNAVRYARSSVVAVSLVSLEGGAVLRVTDDGCGFDSAAVRGGIGMMSMRERAGAVGAVLEIESGGAGTTVTLELTGRERA